MKRKQKSILKFHSCNAPRLTAWAPRGLAVNSYWASGRRSCRLRRRLRELFPKCVRRHTSHPGTSLRLALSRLQSYRSVCSSLFFLISLSLSPISSPTPLSLLPPSPCLFLYPCLLNPAMHHLLTLLSCRAPPPNPRQCAFTCTDKRPRVFPRNNARRATFRSPTEGAPSPSSQTAPTFSQR